MDFKVVTKPDTTSIELSGVLTFDDHERFKAVVEAITVAESDGVELDLTGMKMIDSAGIGMLLLANDRAGKAGKTLALRGVTGHVAKVVELSKVDQIIKVL
ncbi:MAG: STAS domain-containing protein [Alphaproteobacteria bacterium]|nr:STAS domain-containing protein [Alphaproteobacteria bacterium]